MGFPSNQALEEVDEDLSCAVCLDIYTKPVIVCNQGHSCCNECATKVLGTCPHCRSPMLSTPTPNIVIQKIVGKIKICCEMGVANKGGASKPPAAKRQKGPEKAKKSSGCEWTGSLESYATHRASCGLIPVACQLQGCAHTCARKDMDAHAQVCNFRLVDCPYNESSKEWLHGKCTDKVAYSKLEAHKNACIWRPAKCHNDGCDRMIQGLAQKWWKHVNCPMEKVPCKALGVAQACVVLRKDMEQHLKDSEAMAVHFQGALAAQAAKFELALEDQRIKSEAKLQSQSQKIEKLESELFQTNFFGGRSWTNSKLDSLERRVGSLEENIDCLENLEASIDSHEKRVESLEESIDSLEKSTKEMRSITLEFNNTDGTKLEMGKVLVSHRFRGCKWAVNVNTRSSGKKKYVWLGVDEWSPPDIESVVVRINDKEVAVVEEISGNDVYEGNDHCLHTLTAAQIRTLDARLTSIICFSAENNTITGYGS